jgi:hypothetical protein
VFTRDLKFVGSRNRERLRDGEDEIERGTRSFRGVGFYTANSVGSIMVLSASRAMIMIVCFAVMMMMYLGMGVNQASMLEKCV